ncbi:MAG: family 10 glycosylhydrolase [Candidatus Marinimicrobia bacterium]|nr:family 10 glycosylhydrolase [Candidatus Neomarinimicrobiota bacterium]
MKKVIMALLVSGLIINGLFAKDMPPKREFRAVWLSTVANIDWPKNKLDSDSKKQNDLKNYLVKLKDSGCNAVLMQVRCSCDAMYKSDIEPWSYWFSGTQGTGPTTEWDPLTFAVEEAHKLGMELHAWVNPYRAVVGPTSTNVNDSKYISAGHVTKQHPEWILRFSDVHILDPGLPQVRDYISNVLMDIVMRYDIDGLHMDDYFYPYSVIENEDASTFAAYPRGISNIGNWRRDNINLLVETIMDSINIVKPWVKWGISPFGIYRPGVPPGISGMDAYNVLYCDPLAWLAAQSVDYITPQCYWPFGGGQDYGTLIPWWAAQAANYNRHFYPGQAMYRAGLDTWPRGEIPRQIRKNRKTYNCDGSVFFTANDFYDNHKNTIDSLKLDLYRYPALWPVMSWKDSIPPEKPQNALFTVEGDGSKTISWDAPDYTDPSDSGYAYVVYRAPYPLDDISDMSNAKEIQINQVHEYSDNDAGMYYYGITSLDRNKLESPIADIDYPFVRPIYPPYADASTPKDFSARWADKSDANQFTMEISASNDFIAPLQQYTLNDTAKDMALNYQTSYYWRVKADNTVYWSPTWVFTTELPPQVQIQTPFVYYEGTEIDPVLTWNHFEDAVSFDLEVARDGAMSELLLNETAIVDTCWQLNDLDYASYYYWRVRSNKYDHWTDIYSFKTREEFIVTLWEQSAIAQNYPAFLDTNLEATGLALGSYQGNDIVIILQSYGDSIHLNALNAHTGMSIPFTLNLEGINGGQHALRDIEISEDGVIYASNCAAIGETFKVYQWTDPTSVAQCVYEVNDIAYRLGDHITVVGRYDDASIRIFIPAALSNKMLRLDWNVISSGFEATQLTLDRNNGRNPAMALSPDSEELFVTSNQYYLRHFTASGENISWMLGNLNLPVNANAISSFAYNGKTYIAGYVKDTESAYIIDITDGVSIALSAGSTYRLGMNKNPNLLGDIEVFDHENGIFTIYVLGNQNGVGAYTFDAASAMVNTAELSVPNTIKLGNNYPNPFNPITTIPYSLREDNYIEIKIHNIEGRLVSTLYEGYQLAGSHEIQFDASGLSSGMYICTLRAGDVKVARKMTLLK